MNDLSYSEGARLSIFCPKRLLRHMANRGSRAVAVLDIVRNLISNGQTPINQAREAIALEQLRRAAQQFHRIKGSVANLGGMRVNELADELEQMLERDADPVVIEQLLVCLEREYDLFLIEAQKWLLGEEARFFPLLDSGSSQNRQLALFAQTLKEHNFNACDLFVQLRIPLKHALPPQEFLILEQAVEALAFDRAFDHLPANLAQSGTSSSN